jgi:hypothetical protein
MPIPGTEYVRRYKDGFPPEDRLNRCACCNVVLRESVTGIRKTPDGCVCSDCYWRELSDEIERLPAMPPRMDGGR